jgi:pimeloyl-ACP methyl ester carboxylesterase
MKEMQKKINNAEYVEIKKAGHMTPIENPEEVNQAIKNFCEYNWIARLNLL